MAKVTEQGYVLKTLPEYLKDERDLYVAIDPKWDLDPSTPDGLKIAHDAEIWAAFDEALQQAYNSKDPNKARRIELDFVAALTNTFRKSGSPSNVDLHFTGVPYSTVLLGTVVESPSTGDRWEAIQSVQVGIDGIAIVPFRSVAIGPIEALPNSITRMINVPTGITSVTNPGAAVLGTNEENDPSLRKRRQLEVARPGSNQIDSLYGNISTIQDVRRVAVYENPTALPDVSDENPHGISTPHCYDVIVDGGADDDIAMAMYLKKNPGTAQHQSGTPVDVWVTSPSRSSHKSLMKFSRPVYVPVSVFVKIKDDGTLPPNAADLVKDAYMEYASGELTATACGFRQGGFDIGQSVPYTAMYVPANKVIGQFGYAYVTEMTLNGLSADVPIAYNELSQWSINTITVEIIQ
ncbi:hypothetical protein CASP1_00075 [Alcaligenes phage CASP1]|nr:hypothetical protein CASP1_00075 [Alcaligenes phage CASP1]